MNPNQVNNFFGIKVSKPGIPVNQASDKELVYQDNFSTKIYYDNTNARIVEGLLPDGNYGMWVSQPGQDATNANAATNNTLIFNSNQDIFNIVSSGSISLSPPASWASGQVITATIYHGLGIVPAFQTYVQNPSITGSYTGAQGITNLPSIFFVTGSAAIYTQARSDTNNLYIDLVNVGSSTDTGLNVYTWSYTYYILQQSAV
jgi:hypothetical protein